MQHPKNQYYGYNIVFYASGLPDQRACYNFKQMVKKFKKSYSLQDLEDAFDEVVSSDTFTAMEIELTKVNKFNI